MVHYQRFCGTFTLCHSYRQQQQQRQRRKTANQSSVKVCKFVADNFPFSSLGLAAGNLRILHAANIQYVCICMYVCIATAFSFVDAEVIRVLSVGQLFGGKLLMAAVSMHVCNSASCCLIGSVANSTTWRVAVAASCTVAGLLMLQNMLER